MAKVKPKFTIGCDPEFFLRQRQSGKLISAIPFVKGTKEEPMRLPRGGNIQRDNVAVEIATDPAASAEEFVANVGATLSEAVCTLPKETEIVALPSACFGAEELQHPEALRFGCDPDYDAWAVAENDPPCAADASFRSCGAHIHVGTTGDDENAFLMDFDWKLQMVRVMDCVHGVISTILDSGQEAIDRRQLYGKPGAHRPKDYGVEYRVLSNYWLKSPVTVMMMYYLTQDALQICRDKRHEALIEEIGEDRVREVISSGNVGEARRIFEENLKPVLSEDSLGYFEEALSKIEENDMDFHQEWNLYKEKHA